MMSPDWGLGRAKWLNMARHGPQQALYSWVSYGPKISICISFVMESVLGRLDRKGAQHHFGSFWAILGLFWPVPDPKGLIRGV